MTLFSALMLLVGYPMCRMSSFSNAIKLLGITHKKITWYECSSSSVFIFTYLFEGQLTCVTVHGSFLVRVD